MRTLFQWSWNMQVRQTVERLLSKKQVREIVGLGYSQMARLEKAGLFPLKVRLTVSGAPITGWGRRPRA
jgi:predicted DNA-binding transcriptional regulator AlpA